MTDYHVKGKRNFIKRKKKKVSEKPDEGRCIRCGCQLRQKFDTAYGWRPFCPDCGWTGDPVPVE